MTCTCIPEQRYRKRWLCRVFVPVAGAALLLFIKPALRSNIQPTEVLEEKSRPTTSAVKNDPVDSQNHDTAPEQSYPLKLSEELRNADVKEPAVHEENGEVNENLSQNDESKQEEQSYAEQRENYFPGIHTASGFQFLIAVVCLVISYAVLVCVEKLRRACRKYGLATLAIVLAISAFAQFMSANKSFNKQGATIAAKNRQIVGLREKLKQSNWEIGNTTTLLKDNRQLIGNTTIEIETLNISQKEHIVDNIDFATKQDEMHKNHVEMLEERCIERINELKDNLTRTVIVEKDEMKRNISQSDTSVQELNLKGEAQRKEIAELTIKVLELNETVQRTIKSKDEENNWTIKLKDEEIKWKDEQIKRKDEEIKWAIKSKDEEIKWKDEQIKRKDEEIKRTIKSKDEEIEQQRAKCTVLQLIMANIYFVMQKISF